MAFELSALVSSIRVAYDLAKGIGSLKLETERNKAVADILRVLVSVEHDSIALKEKYDLMLEEKDALAEKLVKLEDWKLTEKRYELKQLHRGVFAYVLKEAAQAKEPIHWLCTNCWSQKKKSILQAKYDTETAARYVCLACPAEIHWKKGSDDSDDYDLNDGYRRGAY